MARSVADPGPVDSAAAPDGGGRRRLPRWRAAMSNHTWRLLDVDGANTLRDVAADFDPDVNPAYPANSPWHGNSGPPAMMKSWNGMGWRSDANEMFGFLLGGHGNYGGNEGYRIRLDAEAPAWTMTGYPSGAKGTASLGFDRAREWLFADGRPRAMHVHDYLLYCPYDDSYLVMGGNSPWAASWTRASRRVWQMDPDSGRYTLRATHASQANHDHCGACWDSASEVAWVLSDAGGPGISRFDPADDSFVSMGLGATDTHNFSSTLVYDPVRDVVLVFGRSMASAFRVYGKRGGAVTSLYTPGRIVGTPPSRPDLYGPAVAYIPQCDRFVVWSQSGTVYPRTDFYVLTPPRSDPLEGTWTWSRHQPVAANTVSPSAAQANGTYGRMVWSSTLEAIMLVNDIDEYFYAYAIDGGML